MLNFYFPFVRCTRFYGLHVSPCAFLYFACRMIEHFLEEKERERERKGDKQSKQNLKWFSSSRIVCATKIQIKRAFQRNREINKGQKLDNSLACHIYHALFHAIRNHQLSPLIHIPIFHIQVSTVHQYFFLRKSICWFHTYSGPNKTFQFSNF